MKILDVAIRRRLLLLGVLANAVLLITVALAAVATADMPSDREGLLYVGALVALLVPIDIALAWLLCGERIPDPVRSARATV